MVVTSESECQFPVFTGVFLVRVLAFSILFPGALFVIFLFRRVAVVPLILCTVSEIIFVALLIQ